MVKITKHDLGNLADIIWWIRGYRAGMEAEKGECPFVADHVETLRKCRIALAPTVSVKQEVEEEG